MALGFTTFGIACSINQKSTLCHALSSNHATWRYGIPYCACSEMSSGIPVPQEIIEMMRVSLKLGVLLIMFDYVSTSLCSQVEGWSGI